MDATLSDEGPIGASDAFEVTVGHRPDAVPLIEDVPEPATGSLKIVGSSQRASDVAGCVRTCHVSVLIAGSVFLPLSVTHADGPPEQFDAFIHRRPCQGRVRRGEHRTLDGQS